MDLLRATLALRSVAGLGSRTFLALIDRLGGSVAVMTCGREALEGAGVPSRLAASIESARDLRAVEAEIRRTEASGGSIVVYEDPAYPLALRATADPPPALWVRGSIEPDDVHAAAIVGARDASAYGLAMSERLGRDLAQAGVTVVSGLALGVDGAAHRGALGAGGRTIAVLGSGLDHVYPARHRRLAEEIADRGAVVSEHPCDARPDPTFFPRRNRIISGLSLAIVVVEAGARSGSLITARLAADEGREVFAVPGEANAPRTRGTHALLREGAVLAESGEDVVADALPWLLAKGSESGQTRRFLTGLGADHKTMLDCIDKPAIHIDELVGRSGLGVGRVLECLLELQLRGLVHRQPGMFFSRRVP